MGAILFPVLQFMDYFISVDNFKWFMTYRLRYRQYVSSSTISIRLIEIEKAGAEIDERFRRILNNEPLIYEAEHDRKDGTRFLLEISSRSIVIGGVPYIQSFIGTSPRR